MNDRDRTITDLKPYGTLMAAPLSVFCSLGPCNTLIRIGEPVIKIDGCTFVHPTCSKAGIKNFSAHKSPSSDLRIG